MSKVKHQHHVPQIRKKAEKNSGLPYPRVKEPSSLHIYNELFRSLAWHGRDTEFLSLWDEVKKGVSHTLAPLTCIL
jgi:hypothetical protein